LKGCGLEGCGKTLTSLFFERARLHRLRKNPDSSHALKGCGFQPHRKSRKINPGFSRCGIVPTWMRVFPQPVQPLAMPQA
jgi:hypothetical protein